MILNDAVINQAGVDSTSTPMSRARGRSVELTSPLLSQRHRGWVLGLPVQCGIPQSTGPLVIAVGGGKGGVGKSLIASNIAAKLSQLGIKTAAFDLDMGGANLHTYFGMNGVSAGIGDWLVQGRLPLIDVLMPTQMDGLYIASAQKDDAWAVSDRLLSAAGFGHFWSGLMSLGEHGIQVVLLDLGAGTSRHTIDLFCCAHVGVITALPEPTSVENAYLFIRATLIRLLTHASERLGRLDEGLAAINLLNQETAGAPGRSYTDKLRQLYQLNPSLVGPMATAISGRLLCLLMNQTRSQADIDIGKAMEMAAQRYFGFTASCIGHLNYDEAAWKSLRNRRLLLQDFPHSSIAKRLGDATASLLKQCGFHIPPL